MAQQPLKTYRTASGRSISQILQDYGDKAMDALGKGLYREATGIVEASKGLVPVDTSSLRSSGYVEEPKREGDHIVVNFGYGGPAAKINPKTGESTDGYALLVHEDMEKHHPVGSAKYLELPFNEATKGMDKRLADTVRSQMKGGVSATPSAQEGE